MKSYYFPLLAVLALSSCQTKQETAPQQESDLCKTITLNDGVTTVTNIKDNEGDKLMPRTLFPEASDSIIAANHLEEGVPASISTFLMHTNGQWLLFDTGLGAAHSGQQLKGLAEMGLTPDSISAIYLTHFHPDHIGGMLQEGQPIFKNAKVYANHMEYMYWNFELSADEAPLPHLVMDAYKDQLQLFKWGDTLPNDILAISAPGHTPGHTVFRKNELLILGDLMHGFALQYLDPSINSQYDMDPETSRQSRLAILELYYREHCLLAGMHLPALSFVRQVNE